MKEYYDRRAPEYDDWWQVFKRFFTPVTLTAELGGASVLHTGRWFVAVRSPPSA